MRHSLNECGISPHSVLLWMTAHCPPGPAQALGTQPGRKQTKIPASRWAIEMPVQVFVGTLLFPGVGVGVGDRRLGLGVSAERRADPSLDTWRNILCQACLVQVLPVTYKLLTTGQSPAMPSLNLGHLSKVG